MAESAHTSKRWFKPSQDQMVAWLELNFDCKPRRGGAEMTINNPFDDDSGYNFNINVQEGLVHCWRGDEWAEGKSRTFIRFVQLYRHCSYMDAVKEVCGQGISIDAIYARMRSERSEKEKEEEEKQYDIALPEGSIPLIDHKDTMTGRILMNWLASRGMTAEMVRQYSLHFHGMNVVWPYYEYGSLVYWQERDRLNKFFRFPDNSSKGLFLYGFDMVEPNDYVAITEAIFGSTTLGNQAVATGGAVMTIAQVHRLRALNPVNGVILAPDNDKAGMASIVSNYRLLHPYFQKLYWSVPPRIEYKKDRFIKDWNNFYEYKLADKDGIRKVFEDNIKPLDQQTVVRFMLASH